MATKKEDDKYAPRYTPPEKYKPKPVNPNKKPEKVPGFTVASFFGLWVVFAVKFAVDFLLLPNLFPDLYPLTAGGIALWVASTVLFSALSMHFVSGMWFFYPFADLVYAILVAIFPMGLYGTAEYFPGVVLALLMVGLMWVIQRIILWIMILFSFITM